jgi:serine/threonine-protein kinase RsbW
MSGLEHRMTETAWTWSLHEKIPSSLNIAHQYLETFLQALRDAGWEGRDYFHVQMASEEALVNAVTHGNQQSPDKRVEIEFYLSPQQVNLRIKDEGKGFNVEALPDPRSEERLEMVHGRGVLLIRQMMSDVRYVGSGNEVIMTRRRHDPRFDIPDDDGDDEDDDVDIFTDD